MKYKIVCNGKVIGESDLEDYDDGMNVRSGKFYPTKEYEMVRPIFLLFSSAQSKTPHDKFDEEKVKRYYESSGKLNLTVIGDADLKFIGQIHIEDFSLEAGEEGYYVTVYPN
jgi:hypothetical protein